MFLKDPTAAPEESNCLWLVGATLQEKKEKNHYSIDGGIPWLNSAMKNLHVFPRVHIQGLQTAIAWLICAEWSWVCTLVAESNKSVGFLGPPGQKSLQKSLQEGGTRNSSTSGRCPTFCPHSGMSQGKERMLSCGWLCWLWIVFTAWVLV